MRKILSFAVCAVFLICSISMVSAENYQTTINAFTYNGYSIPSYDGDSVEIVNQNVPKFTDAEKVKVAKVQYGNLDAKGRCTAAFADLNKSLMPTWQRGSISTVYPTGWEQTKYDSVPGKYLYNRCHLIGWQLTGADLTSLSKAELSKNLITGTRYLNVGNGTDGMVGYENQVADYLKASDGNYVEYKVTPVFQGNNLVASGVLMEGQSIGTSNVKFCVFCYNVQPEIAIDYATGKSVLASSLDTSRPISQCIVTLGMNTAEYTGKPITPSITVKDGETTLQNDVSYKVTYANNTLPGRASVKIVGVGQYRGASVKYYIIFPGRGKISTTATNNTSIKITAAENKGCTGYQFSYRQKNKTWMNMTTTSRTKKFPGLKKNTDYQFKVRAYKTVNGMKYYGKWSDVKSLRTKK